MENAKGMLALAVALAAVACGAAPAALDVSPGDVVRLSSQWDGRGVPRSVYVRPYLAACDAAGKRVWAGTVGAFYQRAFDPSNPHIQKWCAYARVRASAPEVERDSVARYRPMGVAGVVLPPTAARLELKLTVEGGTAEWTGESNSIVRIEGKIPYKGMKFPPLPREGVVSLDDAALDAALAARAKDRMELSSVGDRTMAKLNGRPFIPRIYKNTSEGDPEDLRRIPAVFSKCGFNLFVVQFGLADNVDADAPERIRRELRERLRHAPDAHLMLGFNVQTWEGWGEAHPTEMFRNAEGGYGLMKGCRVTEFADVPKTCRGADSHIRRPAFSYASETFAAAAGEAMARIIRHLEGVPEGKALAGVYIGGGCDGQWFDLFDGCGIRLSADYSDAALKGYRAYLRRKYGDRADTAAQIPSYADFWTPRAHFSEHGPSPESDYREYLAWTTARFTGTLATAVRNACGGRLLVGGYYSNAGLGGFPKISLAGTRQRLAADDGWSFCAVVPSYAREYADPVIPSVFNGSFVRRGRLYVGELDLRNPEVGNWRYWGSALWRENHTPATYRTEVLKHVLAAVTAGGAYHAYDMNGNWFSTPAAMETWRVAAEVADAARPMEPLREGIALVGGERYFDHQSFGEPQGRLLAYAIRDNVPRAMAFSGLPHANHLVDEVLDDPTAELPGVVVFNDLSAIGPEAFGTLRSRYAKDRRTLVYTWRPGIFAAGGERIEEALGLRASGSTNRFIVADGTSDDPLMAGITGRMVGSFAPWGVARVEGLVPVDGSGWKELARFEGTSVGGAFVRRAKDFTEVYLAHPAALTPALCRNLAREAGFAPILETDDISGCGSGILWLVAQTDGVRRFRLPPGLRPGKVLVGPAFTPDGDAYAVTMKTAEIFAVALEGREATGRTAVQPCCRASR